MSPREINPELTPVMAGTAGHVDHGKTALVKLLTGCDTDRLKEEKERGLSIDLGFAPCRLPGNRLIGIIDVPGHIDFIRNMVAGAASMDIFILVVAADDGVMPQTGEHMQIVKLLRTPRLMVVLTKIDLVDEETLELAKADIADFIARMGYPDAPILPVSNVTLDGISAVRKTLDELVSGFCQEADNRQFRMNIERIFSLKGFGAVATGIPVSGRISVGDELELLPGGKTTVLRAMQNYKHDSESTGAHVCSALNLRDLRTEDLDRGMTLAVPGCYRAVDSVFVSIRNITGSYSIKYNEELHFHCGTSEMTAKISLIDRDKLVPGETAPARLRLPGPLTLAPGDKYVVRKMSPSITVGGGVVLYPGNYRYKRSSAELRRRMSEAVKSAESGDMFAAALLSGPSPLFDRKTLAAFTGYAASQIDKAVKGLTEGFLADLGGGSRIVRSRSGELLEFAVKLLGRYHENHPASHGIEPAGFCRELGIFPKALKGFIKLAGNSVMIKHDKVALEDFIPELANTQEEAKEKLLKILASGGMNCPTLKIIKQELGMADSELRPLFKLLREENRIVFLDNNHVMTTETFTGCEKVLREIFSKSATLQVGDFRNAAGIGRNLAVAVLEKFDSLGITRRTPDGRILVKKN